MKILIRGGMSPFDNFSATKEIIDDTFGANAGNMVKEGKGYHHSYCI